MIIKNVRIYREDYQFHTGDLYIKGNKIAAEPSVNDTIFDGENAYAIPGLTDIHFHGCVGYDFCDGTKEAFAAIASYEASQGVTQICPATMTLPEEALSGICRAAAAYDNKEGAVFCGINMEGPFVSRAKKGAQNGAYIHKPDAEMFHRLNELSGKQIKIVALAPEEEGALEFIDAVKKATIISIAHTTADYETTMKAMERGASQVTHLYNAMPPFSHRAPGVIGAAMDTEASYIELICDGIHIHPAMVRATFRMFQEHQIILVSDSMMAAGMAEGEYNLGGQTVYVSGRTAKLKDGTIAGSVSSLMDCMRSAVKMGVPLETAVRCAAVNPAKRIGIYDKYGSITVGKIANLVLLKEDLKVKSVFMNGEVV